MRPCALIAAGGAMVLCSIFLGVDMGVDMGEAISIQQAVLGGAMLATALICLSNLEK